MPKGHANRKRKHYACGFFVFRMPYFRYFFVSIKNK